jgi:hypothetical protein
MHSADKILNRTDENDNEPIRKSQTPYKNGQKLNKHKGGYPSGQGAQEKVLAIITHWISTP